jgi:calcium-independent phospholipase A2-gamma
MRGVVTLVLLQELEQRTGRKVHQLFDLVVGTSTGAILACMLGARGLGAEEALRLYRELGAAVFSQSRLQGARTLLASQSYYDAAALEETLRQHLGSTSLDAALQADGLPLLACVATDVTGKRIGPHLLCNYVHPPGRHSVLPATTSVPAVTALLASSAAPGYFPPVEVRGRTLQDGALVANNPGPIALLESRVLWPGRRLQCLVSIGSGRWSVQEEAGDGGRPSAREQVARLMDSLADTEQAHHLLTELLPGDAYYRLNPHLARLPEMDEVEGVELDRIQQDTRMYLRRNKVKLDRLEARLLQPPSVWSRALRVLVDLGRRLHSGRGGWGGALLRLSTLNRTHFAEYFPMNSTHVCRALTLRRDPEA